jgi:hypothetical protein
MRSLVSLITASIGKFAIYPNPDCITISLAVPDVYEVTFNLTPLTGTMIALDLEAVTSAKSGRSKASTLSDTVRRGSGVYSTVYVRSAPADNVTCANTLKGPTRVFKGTHVLDVADDSVRVS